MTVSYKNKEEHKFVTSTSKHSSENCETRKKSLLVQKEEKKGEGGGGGWGGANNPLCGQDRYEVVLLWIIPFSSNDGYSFKDTAKGFGSLPLPCRRNKLAAAAAHLVPTPSLAIPARGGDPPRPPLDPHPYPDPHPLTPPHPTNREQRRRTRYWSLVVLLLPPPAGVASASPPSPPRSLRVNQILRFRYKDNHEPTTSRHLPLPPTHLLACSPVFPGNGGSRYPGVFPFYSSLPPSLAEFFESHGASRRGLRRPPIEALPSFF